MCRGGKRRRHTPCCSAMPTANRAFPRLCICLFTRELSFRSLFLPLLPPMWPRRGPLWHIIIIMAAAARPPTVRPAHGPSASLAASLSVG